MLRTLTCSAKAGLTDEIVIAIFFISTVCLVQIWDLLTAIDDDISTRSMFRVVRTSLVVVRYVNRMRDMKDIIRNFLYQGLENVSFGETVAEASKLIGF